MSIVACVKVQDGIALGCDSATQISGMDQHGNIGILKVYQNAIKLFHLPNLPVGILSYGIGNIEKKSIRTLIREFSKEKTYSPKEKFTISGIANDLLVHTRSHYSQEFRALPDPQKPSLGMFVAGYSFGQSLGEEWEFVLPADNEARVVRPPEQFGSSWRGMSLPFTRLYFGKDPRGIKEIESLGVSSEKIDQVFAKYRGAVIYDGMPVKDAVNFVRFILKTTIGFTSFEIGPPSCSEPIHVAVIDPEKGFKWVDKPLLWQKEVKDER